MLPTLIGHRHWKPISTAKVFFIQSKRCNTRTCTYFFKRKSYNHLSYIFVEHSVILYHPPSINQILNASNCIQVTFLVCSLNQCSTHKVTHRYTSLKELYNKYMLKYRNNNRNMIQVSLCSIYSPVTADCSVLTKFVQYWWESQGNIYLFTTAKCLHRLVKKMIARQRWNKTYIFIFFSHCHNIVIILPNRNLYTTVSNWICTTLTLFADGYVLSQQDCVIGTHKSKPPISHNERSFNLSSWSYLPSLITLSHWYLCVYTTLL